jgi:hypothetical protein
LIDLDDDGVLFFLVTSVANSFGVSRGNVIVGANCREGASMLNSIVGSFVFLFLDFGGPRQHYSFFITRIEKYRFTRNINRGCKSYEV